MLRIASAPSTDESADALRITNLGSACTLDGSATSVSSKHMVKPMPPKSPTMPRCLFDMPEGMLHMPQRTASHVKPKMPSGLPSSSPAPMPMAGVAEVAPALAAAPSLTAVLASAKSGMMKKALSGTRRPMARCATDSILPAAVCIVALVERQRAARTPATSALTPARRRQYQREMPPAEKIFRSLHLDRPIAVIAATIAAAAARKGGARPCAKQVASTRMAPKSSTVASVNRNAEALAGIRLRKKPKMAIAKAMSVAIGMVTPSMEPAGSSVCAMT
mmetsp:Transcript_20984/g.44252  ORF Transcript_20984/g.44252 Transcript_20984/m.44252 type:complete len:277 (+) Transcript_20984:375-1205(+)